MTITSKKFRDIKFDFIAPYDPKKFNLKHYAINNII